MWLCSKRREISPLLCFKIQILKVATPCFDVSFALLVFSLKYFSHHWCSLSSLICGVSCLLTGSVVSCRRIQTSAIIWQEPPSQVKRSDSPSLFEEVKLSKFGKLQKLWLYPQVQLQFAMHKQWTDVLCMRGSTINLKEVCLCDVGGFTVDPVEVLFTTEGALKQHGCHSSTVPYYPCLSGPSLI